jgi:hypothetical protein
MVAAVSNHDHGSMVPGLRPDLSVQKDRQGTGDKEHGVMGRIAIAATLAALLFLLGYWIYVTLFVPPDLMVE